MRMSRYGELWQAHSIDSVPVSSPFGIEFGEKSPCLDAYAPGWMLAGKFANQPPEDRERRRLPGEFAENGQRRQDSVGVEECDESRKSNCAGRMVLVACEIGKRSSCMSSYLDVRVSRKC